LPKTRRRAISSRAPIARLRLSLAQNSPVVAVNRPESDDCQLAREASGARGAIRGALLGSLVHLFRRYENSRLEVNHAAGADSERNCRRRDVVGNVNDNESVGVPKREVEALNFPADGGKHLVDILAPG